jgi:putative transposase
VVLENKIKSFKFELRLNKKQKELCKQFGGSCRYIWNKFLEIKNGVYEEERKSLNEFDLNNFLPKWKIELPWLCLSPSQALQQVSKNLCEAFRNFFNGSGYPKFKKKGGRDSFRIPQGIKLLPQISRKVGVVQLPKLKKVRFTKTRKIEGKIKHVTISRDGEKWFISFTCEVEMEIVHKKENFYIVAIDRGITISLQLSDGTEISLPKPLKKSLEKLEILMRALSIKKKGSSNWWKIKRRIQKLFRHIKNVRKDALHKITTYLANNHGIVVLEALDTKNMMKSAKGTVENPGKNVSAKSGLNRSIADEAWGLLQRLLEYKMEWRGGTVAYVDPKNTSRQCSSCKHVSKNNRKSQSRFECEKCGYKANADFNASKNILNKYLEAAGHAVTACGRRVKVLSLNQELRMRKSGTEVSSVPV